MKIKKILVENHYILGNMELDFTDSNGNILNTIIIAGENGTGKSTTLNLISELFNFRSHTRENEKIVYEIELLEDEIRNLLSEEYIKNQLNNLSGFNTVKVTFDTINYLKNDYRNNWFEIIDVDKKVHKIIDVVYLRYAKLKSIFSDVEINFQGKNTFSVTSKELDEEILGIKKSNNKLSQEITQLLIDIKSVDNEEVNNWQEENGWGNPPEHLKNRRSKRFKNAFENMFDSKKYKGVVTVDNSKKVAFTEKDKVIYIENLSSGEKQIVYRGSFCLKDKSKLDGSIAMIDEPEISLHPEWQKKIVPFYQDIFSNESNQQTSQLFIVTHSPFIIHNTNRINDKVIILKKDESGNPVVSDDNKFYGWSNEKVVKEAFNIDEFIKDTKSFKPLIITEGKTDCKHIEAAIKYFQNKGEYQEVDVDFFKFTDETQMGADMLFEMCKSLNQMDHSNKIFCIFDRDKKNILNKIKDFDDDFKIWSNHISSIALPVPEFRDEIKEIFCIEHYYTDEEIKTSFKGKRLFLGDEFKENYGGLSNDKNLICRFEDSLKAPDKKCGKKHIFDSNTIKIEKIKNEEKVLLLSKNEFADCILEKKEGFENFDFESFRPLLELLKELIEKGSITQFN